MTLVSSMQRVSSLKHLVYLSACGDFIDLGLLEGWTCAHGLVNVILDKMLAASKGFKWTIIGPSLFSVLRKRLQSLLARGLYPEPLGAKGVSRVAVADVAEAVARVVQDQGEKWHGRKFKRCNVDPSLSSNRPS